MTVCISRLLILGEEIIVTAKVKKIKEKKARKFSNPFKAIGRGIVKFFTFLSKVKFIGAPLRGLANLGRYFKYSWAELRQVRWTNRKATWGLVLAVLGFSGFFVVLILLLDIAFKELFQLIIK